MYELQVISSHEKSKGRTLHGEELSALAFWLIADTEKKGFFTNAAPVSMLFQGLRFPNIDKFTTFEKEFSFSIPKGELRASGNKVLRFDCMR